MCGITGIYHFNSQLTVEEDVLAQMTEKIHHRGPDETSLYTDKNFGFGFKRLSIIDIENGHQPFKTDENDVILICNGEIYNYKLLRKSLIKKGHKFKTNCDVEVILYLYLEYGTSFLSILNGQFAFAIFDKRKDLIFIARDQFGICPLFYMITTKELLFGSEIKAILAYPPVKRKVNLTGLDQVFSFPGLVSPTTMFDGVISLKPGHYLTLTSGKLQLTEYWDLEYPEIGDIVDEKSENWYIDQIEDLLKTSINYRMHADVPVGFYLSGGLDSSLIGGIMKAVQPDKKLTSFSIGFPNLINREIDERVYQQCMSSFLGSDHHEIYFDWEKISMGLKQAIYHSEMPLKETYNTCSLSLSESVKNNNLKVILSGEGADEIFGGYVGYRFDHQGSRKDGEDILNLMLERQMREKLWGDPEFFYEKSQYSFIETKRWLYSDRLNELFEGFNCLNRLEIDREKIKNRHILHKRSYLDLKLRLCDHLIADHCDRVTYANSIEGRYPFLDTDLVEFVKTVPPQIKLKGLEEKYAVKKIAGKYIPNEIINRQKFGFVAPGSPQLLQRNIPWITDLLSRDYIARRGYFNPDAVERLKQVYGQPGFTLNLPFESDLLIIVLTFNIFLEIFDLPSM